MRIVALASSSKGNAYLVEHQGAVLMIDCGLSYRDLGGRMKSHGLGEDARGQIAAILITHSHIDHVRGLGTFLKHHDVPVYANVMTAETVIANESLPEDSFVCFENGQEFTVGPFAVSPFSIPHDTADPVGYLVRVRDEQGETITYFHGTDIGTPLDSIGIKLAEADIATLESNHDLILLRNSGRAPSLIQRIAGPRGHLSNDQAAELITKFASSKLRQLQLAHLSEDCNAPHLAERAIREALKARHLEAVELTVLAP